jgi:MBG domain (YGX type)/Bacterial Ig-like domain (group 3)
MPLRLSSVHRSTRRAQQQARGRRRSRLWALEGLEGRVLLSGNPTYYTVNLTSDTGACSGTDAYPTTGTPSGDLLWAITQANANTNPAGSVIEFDPTVFATPQTITLSSTLELAETAGPEVIDGPGGNLVTISGGLTYSPSTDQFEGSVNGVFFEGSGTGVFQVDSGTTATLSGVTITGGSAANGAGISNNGCLAVTDSTVEYCIAGNDGGGIDNSGTLMVTGSTIASNGDGVYGGGGEGGGIYNSGALTVTGSTIASNDVGNKGGGIENTGMLMLTNATLAGNGSGNNGGGIDNLGTLTAVNTTIAYNLSNSSNTDGGGLYDEAGASTTLYDTIVALNKGLGEYRWGDIAGAPVSSASAYNLIGVGGAGGLTDADGHHDQVNVADPGLAAGLTNTGGPTETIALLADSPAIDAGSSTIPGVTVPTTDERGFTRPGYSNGVVEIGAVEASSFGNPTVYTVNLTSDTGAFNGTSAATATAGDLLWAITQANANTNPAGSVIEFDPTVFSSSSPQTITLTSTLELSEAPWPEVIQGPGANAVTVSGNDVVQVLQVDGGTTAIISGVTISGGNSQDNSGGIWNLGRLNITGCTIVDNSGRVSGGIGNPGPYGTLTVTNSTIEDNRGGAYGGGVWTTGGAAKLTDCIIEGNSARLQGGGVFAGGSSAINGCTVADNSVFGSGGGIFVGFGALTLTNSTITGNSGGGGAVMGGDWSVFSATSMRVTNCTIADNDSSGGIYVTGSNVTLTLTLDNSIVADNAGGSGTADVSVGPTNSLVAYNNLIGVGSGGLMNGWDGNIVGTQAAPIDPMLGPLQNNGGPTETMALLPGSPALGKGDLADTSADQRGAPADSPPDIGAFQSQGFNVTADITDPTYSSGQVGLTVSAVDGGGNQTAGFIYNINWGDGTAQCPDINSVPASAGNGSGVPLSHTYANPGVYKVSLTAVDEGLEVSPPATAVIVVSSTPGDNISLSGGSAAGQVVISSVTTPATVYTPTDLAFVAGEGGSDTYTVNFGSTLTAPITIAGSGGGDTLVVNGDSSSTNVINKTPGQITWGSPVTETITRSGIPNTTINANGTSQNYVNDPGGNTTINGGPGANTVVITASSGNGVVINGGPSANNYIVDLGSLAGPVTIDNSNASASNSLVVDGAAGKNTITASGSQVTAGSQTINVETPLTSETIEGGSGNNQITVANLTVPVQSLTLDGGGGTNTFTLTNAGTDVGALEVNGSGTGTNTVQVQGSLPANLQPTDITPVVAVTDAGGTYNGLSFAATASVTGVSSSPASSLEGVGPTLAYYTGSSPTGTVLSGAPRTVGTYTVVATFAGSADYTPASAQATFAITPAPLVITANNQAKVYGQANPALTVSYSAFGNGDSSSSLTTLPTITTTATTSSPVGSYPITASGAVDPNYAISYVAGTLTVNQDSTTTAASASATSSGFGQSVTLSATVTANAPGSGTPTGSVDFFDATTSDDLGSVALSGGKASLSTASLPVGGNTIKLTYSGDSNFLSSTASTGTITINQSIIVLDPTAGGALSLSGNASISLAGVVVVDSSSSTAISASGNAAVKASVIDVTGKVQKSGNASFSPAPTTGAAVMADPLASLAEPSTSSLTNYGSESLSGNSSATIKPGIYSAISASGNATLTLSSGFYIIEGGGFAISGNASVAGTGVTIFNAGSKYPTTGGTYGSISLSGNGSYNLTPPTSGTYAGIVIFQSRDNSEALTVSGNASGMTGTIYAKAAQLSESGNADLNAAIVVDTLTASGNGVANAVTLRSSAGTVAYTPNQIRDSFGINDLSLDGTGQTIAIVDAYDDPDIFQAVDVFDSQFGLTDSGPTLYAQYGPASSFLTVLNQYGQATSLPSTDPNGPGTDNWEVEESLDVEWAHAIAPGAQIILVEANSQSLSDLMASVATAATQPGVSVVSMSWGFAEGQAVFASDEATYDSVFNVPGVAFVASTGDYGAADPEYPAYSPNVVAVGGTSLTVNADNSYNSETGWGYYSDSAGAFIGSGGGISLYEPEPVYQQGVQSTGYRTTPDVSLVADPATGAWIADPYNLDPSNPFEVVGGTSLSAPAWAGLLALVNQGRAAAGDSTLNSTSPTDTQQALYVLPQSDYNAITTGTNGYTAGAGYNLVTGLGTPVANLLVPDLIAYQGPSTSYSGPTVAPLQNTGLVNTGTSDGGPMDVFSVFDALTLAGGGVGAAQGQVATSNLSSTLYESPAAGGAGRTGASPIIAAGSTTLGPASNLSPAVLTPLPSATVALTPIATGFMPQQPAWSTVQAVVKVPTSSEHIVVLQRTDHSNVSAPGLTRLRANHVPESILNELASDTVLVRSQQTAETFGMPVLPWDGVITDAPMAVDVAPRGAGSRPVSEIPADKMPMPQSDSSRQASGFAARLAVILLAAGPCGYASGIFDPRNRRDGRFHQKRKTRFLADHRQLTTDN